MRRRFTRTWSATVAATTLALVMVGPLHLLLEEHVWCAEHRELVRAHAHDGLGDADDDHHEPSHAPDRPGLPHSHDADGCAWALLLQAPGSIAQPLTWAAAPAAFFSAPLLTAPEAAPLAIALLDLAPCHSPPALSA